METVGRVKLKWSVLGWEAAMESLQRDPKRVYQWMKNRYIEWGKARESQNQGKERRKSVGRGEGKQGQGSWKC